MSLRKDYPDLWQDDFNAAQYKMLEGIRKLRRLKLTDKEIQELANALIKTETKPKLDHQEIRDRGYLAWDRADKRE